MKKSLALLLSAVMVMGTLVGCGGSDTTETKAAETKAETKETKGKKGTVPMTLS